MNEEKREPHNRGKGTAPPEERSGETSAHGESDGHPARQISFAVREVGRTIALCFYLCPHL